MVADNTPEKSKMKSFAISEAGPLIDDKPESFENLEPKVRLLEKTDTKVSLEFEFPGFWLFYDQHEKNVFPRGEEKVAFSQIKVPGAGFCNETDKPLLPSFGRYWQIPCIRALKSYDARPVRTTYLDDTLEKDINDKIRIKRSEYEVYDWTRSDFGSEDDQDFFRIFYERRKVYPKDGEWAKVTGPYLIDGYKALLVHVRPFQYTFKDQAKKKDYVLAFHNIIRLDIHLQDSEEDCGAGKENKDCGAGAYANLFLNPKREQSGDDEATGGVELLIVHANLPEAAGELSQWKERKGLATEVVSMDRILELKAKAKIDSTAENLKSKSELKSQCVREYISEKRRDPQSKLRYVLFLGDEEDIPLEDGIRSDFYYTTHKKPVNFELVFPWLSCGRIPFSTEDDAKKVVKQIVAYEKGLDFPKQCFDKIALCGFFEDSSRQWLKERRFDDRESRNYVKTMEDIAGPLKGKGIEVESIYQKQKDASIERYCNGRKIPGTLEVFSGHKEAKTALEIAANEGRLIIGHRGHANAEKWLVPELDPNRLQEKIPPSIFFSLNCQTGKFMGPGDCMAESLLKHDGAAPSLIAPTRPSNTWLNNSMMKALFDALWPGILKTVFLENDACENFEGEKWGQDGLKHSRMGDILNYARAYLPIAQSNADSKIRQHFEIYHVLGDPSLEVWRKEPEAMEVNIERKDGDVDVICRDRFPQNTVATFFWEDDKGEKRKARTWLECGSLGFTWKEKFQEPVPEVPLTVYFHAPGYLLEEEHVD